MLLDILFFCPTLFHFFFLHEWFFIQRVWIFFLLNCTLKIFYNVLKRIYQINWKLAFLCIFPFSYISLHHFYLSLFCSPSECHKALGRFAEATFIPFTYLYFRFWIKQAAGDCDTLTNMQNQLANFANIAVGSPAPEGREMANEQRCFEAILHKRLRYWKQHNDDQYCFHVLTYQKSKVPDLPTYLHFRKKTFRLLMKNKILL